PPKIVNVKVKVKNRKRKRIIKVAIPSSKVINRMTVDCFAKGELEFATCSYGRVHTNITRLLTECRTALSIDGAKLASVDIKNSQLVFFLLLLLESRYSSSSTVDLVAASCPQSSPTFHGKQSE